LWGKQSQANGTKHMTFSLGSLT